MSADDITTTDPRHRGPHRADRDAATGTPPLPVAARSCPAPAVLTGGGAGAVSWPPEQPCLDPADIIACLTLDLEPVPKGRPRVSPAEYERVRGARIKVRNAHGYTPAATRKYEEHVGWLLRQARVRRVDSGNVAVHTAFHVRDPDADIDNLVKSLFDACNGLAWADDRQVTRLVTDLVRDSPRPRTELLIYALPAGGDSR